MRIAAAVCLGFLATVVATAEDKPAEAPPWKAGAASVAITPEAPLRMAGYAARKEPALGAEQDLFAKALAVEDSRGARVVFVTLDLIGVRAELRDAVAEELQKKHGLPPEALVMNASHTHCGPSYNHDEAKPYFESLKEKVAAVAGQALERLAPASLSYSFAKCGFAMNRRTPTDAGYRNHPNPFGPVDHTVPVLRVADPDGTLQAVLFGYACHNTTMGFRYWLGDYAGYAQQYFEEDHPGVTALFLMGCGGDQNPYPRSELKYAQMHGRSLATAVEAALETNQSTPRHQQPLEGPLRVALETVELKFAESDRPPVAYPVQVVQFGDALTMVALGSEVVIDYALRLKDELGEHGGPAVWVAGYSNFYDGYIPSRRILLEGGYEAQSRPWAPTLEERIVAKTHELVERLRDEPAPGE
jgi:neutral ceramidase